MNKLVDVSEIEKLGKYFVEVARNETETCISLEDLRALLEASPPVEVEPVGVVVGWSDENGDIPVRWYDTPAVDAKLYTSPPDTEAKLNRAVEALYRLRNLNGLATNIAEKALKDIGEIK